MTHISSRFRWFERLERSIRFWNLDIRRHIGVWPRKSRCFYTVGWQRVLELFSVLSFFFILLLSLLISDFLFPFEISRVSWSKTVLHSLDCLLKQVFLLLFLLLKFQSFTLEHGKLWDCGEHFSRKLSGSSFVLVNLFSDFQGTFSSIKSLSSKLFSQVTYLLIDKFFL